MRRGARGPACGVSERLDYLGQEERKGKATRVGAHFETRGRGGKQFLMLIWTRKTKSKVRRKRGWKSLPALKKRILQTG